MQHVRFCVCPSAYVHPDVICPDNHKRASDGSRARAVLLKCPDARQDAVSDIKGTSEIAVGCRNSCAVSRIPETSKPFLKPKCALAHLPSHHDHTSSLHKSCNSLTS